MWFLRMLRLRARALMRSAAVDDDLRSEMEGHLERLVQEHIARGLSPEAAREAARREFGPVTQLIEQSRDARGVAFLATLAQDLRYGLRLLRRTPGFAAAATLTIALGIGATTAMFSVVDGVLLKPLAVKDQARLLIVWTSRPERGFSHWPFSHASYLGMRERLRTVSGVAAHPYAGTLPGVLHLARMP